MKNKRGNGHNENAWWFFVEEFVDISAKTHTWTPTLLETNVAPENQWLENEFSYWEGLFPGAMLVSGSVVGL